MMFGEVIGQLFILSYELPVGLGGWGASDT